MHKQSQERLGVRGTAIYSYLVNKAKLQVQQAQSGLPRKRPFPSLARNKNLLCMCGKPTGWGGSHPNGRFRSWRGNSVVQVHVHIMREQNCTRNVRFRS